LSNIIIQRNYCGDTTKLITYRNWTIDKSSISRGWGVTPPENFNWHSWGTHTLKEAKAGIDRVIKLGEKK
tara:strand:+ start:282 stop:491 length:210 start_codon:yes stop_codon:yes gene_type:complete